MKSTKTDYELITSFMNGDERSIELLILRHKSKVYSYISLYIRSRDLADDIFQDTFLKVVQSVRAGRYQDDGRFLSWVMRIAHNLIIDHFRHEKQMGIVLNDDYESDLFNSRRLADENVEDVMVRRQVLRDVRRLVSELPEDQREVVIMRHYAGMSFREIADMTGVSINTALGRMRYALINMRKIMEEKNITLSIS
ncbi:MAG: sigma-70 family RNA polymerase sigma factor [Bacteroidales bacterium]|jgi:RNA polymerase sigma-70 factor (ECF subfamily)|nr:sigma-70 family RNA polymerase sigma factor [Bacteroidales bacterium]MCU0410381.1 sigma-70 family RNA polymerase sigma factor [Bacteroidales bacterium]